MASHGIHLKHLASRTSLGDYLQYHGAYMRSSGWLIRLVEGNGVGQNKQRSYLNLSVN